MLTTEVWHCANLILLGDAAHTAHFSIGSGTKLAMEDSIELAYQLGQTAEVATALERYEEERRPQVRRFVNAAYESLSWFEGVERYMAMDDDRFAFSLLTRSRRLSYETLRLRDAELVDRVHAWLRRVCERSARRCRRCSRPSACAA